MPDKAIAGLRSRERTDRPSIALRQRALDFSVARLERLSGL
jgi:hypothetical protein